MNNFWKSKKVVVTGGSGFIGSHVVDLLVEKGAVVTVQISGKSSEKNLKSNLSNKSIKVVAGDLTDYNFCNKLLGGQEIVLCFAASDGGSAYKREHSAEIFRTNSQITLNILEASKSSNIKKILIVSSIEIYPESAKQPIAEGEAFIDDLNEDKDGYAWSKRFSEIAARMYNTQYGLNVSIIRPGNVYGPFDHKDKGRVIPTFIQQALDGEPITIWNGGRQLKSFIYVKDLARAALQVVEKSKKCDPINIVSEKYLSIKDLAILIIKTTKSKSTIKNVDMPVVLKDKVIDTKKLKEITGFKEETSIDDGILNTVVYIKKN